jgi:hypothetical protein
MLDHFVIRIFEILRTHSGQDAFQYLGDAPQLQWHSYRPPPPDYKWEEFVLRTTTLDEGSTDGTIQVNENLYLKQLEFGIHDLDDQAVPSFHDQKTNALIRSAQLLRRHDIPSAILRLQQHQLGIGWFHAQMNLAWLILRVHRGKASEVGSLAYYIALLGKTRLGEAHPDYETMIALFAQVLEGHVLHYWEIETGIPVTEIADKRFTADELVGHAKSIFLKYMSDNALSTSPAASSSDAAPRNVILMNRDLLIFSVLKSSVSSGDFGRVELLLGRLTVMFAGGGSKHYTHELLHFKQNLKYGWPPEFAYTFLLFPTQLPTHALFQPSNVMRDNSLIRLSKRSDHFIGVDKNTEHNIHFQKVVTD